MIKNKPLRYTMFAMLYFTQGTILSYFTALNAIYFLSRGVSMARVGIFSSIALIPFIIKIAYGMISDRFNLLGMGHRKPYILIGLFIQAACLVVVAFIDPGKQYWGFVAMAFLLQMGMALYDTCTDGLALDTTPPEEQGTIQGFMVGGRALGVVVTAAVVGLLAEKVSWAAVFWLLAVLTLLPLPLVLIMKEPDRSVGRRFEWTAFAAFKQRRVIIIAIIGLLFFLVIIGANQWVNPFLQAEFDISLGTAGFFTTLWGAAVVVGSLVGGTLTDRLGHSKGSWLALAFVTLSVFLLGVTPSLALAWVLVPLFGLAYGIYQTIYFALAMDTTDERIAASMFSILMAFTNIGQAIGLGIGGFLTGSIGFRYAFMVFAALNLLSIPLLPVIAKKNRSSMDAPIL